jgi:glyoxylase-like metal-dependent hydrolase (beta-lactamase superfamily II)
LTSAETKVISLSLSMTRAFALVGDRTVLVDAGNPGKEQKILAKLDRAGVSPSDVSLILITHGHADHFGGAAALKEATGAPVAVHAADAEPLRRGHDPPLIPTGATSRWMIRLIGRFVKSGGPPVEPDLLLDGETSLEEFGVQARVIPTPGHTPGSVSVVVPGGPALVADLIFGGFITPRRPKWPWFADDLGLVQRSIQTVLDLAPTTILAAHGGPFSPGDVRQRLAGQSSA